MLVIDGVLSSVRASCKEDVMHIIATQAAALSSDVSSDATKDNLLAREEVGTTGVGDGVAIPHCKVAGLADILGIFLRLEEPVHFDAVDEQPVDLVFAILAPEDSSNDHLTVLATISRLLRDKKMCSKLRGANSNAALYALLTAPPESSVA